MLDHDPTIELRPPLERVEHDPFIDGLHADIPPPAREALKGGDDVSKQRIIVLDDRLVPRLVHVLEEELKIERDEHAVADETGQVARMLKIEKSIVELKEIQDAIGPEACPHCDDNQGRLDGRGCRGCNTMSTLIDDAVEVEGKPFPEDIGPVTHDDWGQPVGLSAGSLFVDQDAQMGYLPPHD